MDSAPGMAAALTGIGTARGASGSISPGSYGGFPGGICCPMPGCKPPSCCGPMPPSCCGTPGCTPGCIPGCTPGCRLNPAICSCGARVSRPARAWGRNARAARASADSGGGRDGAAKSPRTRARALSAAVTAGRAYGSKSSRARSRSSSSCSSRSRSAFSRCFSAIWSSRYAACARFLVCSASLSTSPYLQLELRE